MGEQFTGRQNEEIAFSGRIFEIVHHQQPDGRNFEIARRAPGVRLIIADKEQKKVLLTREFRQELQDWDYRLPGGKVFDSLEEFETHRQSGDDILDAAKKKAIAEGAEEAGVVIESLELTKKSTLGATVEWDLYVFEVTKWQQGDSQALEDGEMIEADNWFSYEEAEAMVMSGGMQEERIALALLQWVQKHKEVT